MEPWARLTFLINPKTNVNPLATRKYNPAIVTPLRRVITKVFFLPIADINHSGHTANIIQRRITATNRIIIDKNVWRSRNLNIV